MFDWYPQPVQEDELMHFEHGQIQFTQTLPDRYWLEEQLFIADKQLFEFDKI
jgi:hypothetical protein